MRQQHRAIVEHKGKATSPGPPRDAEVAKADNRAAFFGSEFFVVKGRKRI